VVELGVRVRFRVRRLRYETPGYEKVRVRMSGCRSLHLSAVLDLDFTR